MRVFFAIALPDCLSRELKGVLGYLSRRSPGGINWVAPENLHLTINFIGDVPEHQISDLAAGIQAILQDFTAFEFQAEGLELFPAKNPRLVWLKLSGAEALAQKLNRKVLALARDLGLGPDAKKLKLHITLGRIKSPQSPDFERSAIEYPFSNTQALCWDSAALYHSILSPKGPVYKILQQYKLD